jgi:outer membrane protein OmpA-like peptidoglycan-associated protein
MNWLTPLLMIALLVGCATLPATVPAALPAATTLPRAASGLSPALEAQRLRLAEAVAGTPVVVAATERQQLRVEVPLKFAFDAGRSTVKPPLAAVLDQLATGYKPQVLLTELAINAPTDGPGSEALARERAKSVRDHLVVRGAIPANRVVGLGQSGRAVVEILISDRVTVR